jgi:hypothetical protein
MKKENEGVRGLAPLMPETSSYIWLRKKMGYPERREKERCRTMGTLSVL